ncbi:MAG: hypothetical protein R8K53_02620 [Mariprofundaceae bacterium]
MQAWKLSLLGAVVICMTVDMPSALSEDRTGVAMPFQASVPLKAPAVGPTTGTAAEHSPAQGLAAGQRFEAMPPSLAPNDTPVAMPETTSRRGPKTATDKIVDKFMLLDIDASAGVSMDEYITIVQQRVMTRFAAMDANRDGEVSEDEYRVFWKSRMAKWYRLKR